MIRRVLLTGALFIFASALLFCAGTKKKKVVVGGGTQESTATKIVEDFDPESLGEYELSQDLLKETKVDVADIDQILKGGGKADSLRAVQVPGYRVQLISTRDEEEARAIRQNALLTFDENVYLRFDDPYYKVRIGDFISRYKAEELQKKAVEKGFLEAWVVRANVLTRPESKEKEEE